MDRKEAAAIIAEVAIQKTRTDVPADVVEAIGVLLKVIAQDGADIWALAEEGAGIYLTDEARAVADRIQGARREALERWEAEKAAGSGG